MLQPLKFSFLVLCLFIIGSCGDTEQKKEMQEKMKNQPAPIEQKNIPEDKTANDTIKKDIPKNLDTTLFPIARQVLSAMKKKDYKAIAAFIHPEKGLTFSPYAYVMPEAHQHFSKKAFAQISKTKKYHWGNFSGSGDPIKLNINDYFNRFVYNMDFMGKAQIIQDESLGSSTTLDNIKEVYSGCNFVEFYISGPPGDESNWGSLRLVFCISVDGPGLVAVVHDEWTI